MKSVRLEISGIKELMEKREREREGEGEGEREGGGGKRERENLCEKA